MATMCSTCRGIVNTEIDCSVCLFTDNDFFIETIALLHGFADTATLLRDKGYRLIGYHFPLVDGWGTDCSATLVFDRQAVPAHLPPKFSIGDLPMINGVAFYRAYEVPPKEYKAEVKQSAEDLRVWAGMLPAADLE